MVTVIVPAYNHEKYILECLESIDQQTYRKFQWIVVDDGSKDNTTSILKKYQNKFGYQLIIQKNKGLSRTLTDTIRKYAYGKYISICASDDFWLHNKIEKQVEFMENHPEYAMCYGRTYNVDINSNIINEESPVFFKGGMIFIDIITQKFHPPVNYMIRREVLEEVGYYPQDIIAEDFYMNCLISHKYLIGYIPEILGFYRVAELKTKRDPYSLYKSHEETINLYKNEKIYKVAISKHFKRCFYVLSSYKGYKTKSLEYFIKSYKEMDVITFIKSVYHLLFIWR